MITITITKSGVAGISKQTLRHVGRVAIRAAAILWWEKFLPIHFTKRAIRRYGYTPRKGEPGSGRKFRGSYAESKIKQRSNGDGVKAIGENKPLVWSGRSRTQATQSQNIKAVASSFSNYRADVIIPANTLNFLRGRINADTELRATTSAEEKEIEKVFADAFEAELNRLGRTNRTTTKIAA